MSNTDTPDLLAMPGVTVALTVAVTPGPGGGVPIERFTEALHGAAALLERVNPGGEPWLFNGGHVAADGTVTFTAGPPRTTELASGAMSGCPRTTEMRS